MKGDSGRRQLIPAPGESSFPGLGWGRRVGTWWAGEEGRGGSRGSHSRTSCYQPRNKSRSGAHVP